MTYLCSLFILFCSNLYIYTGQVIGAANHLVQPYDRKLKKAIVICKGAIDLKKSLTA